MAFVDYGAPEKDTSLGYGALAKSLGLFGSLIPERLQGSSILLVASHAKESALCPCRTADTAADVEVRTHKSVAV